MVVPLKPFLAIPVEAVTSTQSDRFQAAASERMASTIHDLPVSPGPVTIVGEPLIACSNLWLTANHLQQRKANADDQSVLLAVELVLTRH